MAVAAKSSSSSHIEELDFKLTQNNSFTPFLAV